MRGEGEYLTGGLKFEPVDKSAYQGIGFSDKQIVIENNCLRLFWGCNQRGGAMRKYRQGQVLKEKIKIS